MRTIDVAAFLGISRQRVDQLVSRDGIPAPRMVAGHRMWVRQDIEKWASEHWWDKTPGRIKM